MKNIKSKQSLFIWLNKKFNTIPFTPFFYIYLSIFLIACFFLFYPLLLIYYCCFLFETILLILLPQLFYFSFLDNFILLENLYFFSYFLIIITCPISLLLEFLYMIWLSDYFFYFFLENHQNFIIVEKLIWLKNYYISNPIVLSSAIFAVFFNDVGIVDWYLFEFDIRWTSDKKLLDANIFQILYYYSSFDQIFYLCLSFTFFFFFMFYIYMLTFSIIFFPTLNWYLISSHDYNMIQIFCYYAHIYEWYKIKIYNNSITTLNLIINNDLKSILPEIILFCFSIILFINLLYFSIKKKNFYFFNSLFKSFRYIYLIIFILLFFYNSFELYYFESFYGNLISYWYICVFKELCLILMLFFFFALKEYMEFSKFYSFEVVILFLLVFTSFLFFLSVNNFLTLYLLLEIYNLSIYSIIGLKRNSNKSVESAIKYFIFGSFSSAILIYAISLIYGSSGFISFTDLSQFFWNNSEISIVSIIGVTLFILAFFFKMAIAPFHFWAVEVYDGAPIIITFFLTLIPKLVFILTLFRIYIDVLFEFHYILNPIFFFFLCLTAIVGVFGALYQIKLKKIFIYSSIFNSSFFLVPFIALTEDIISSWFFFIFVYSFNIVNLFLILLALRNLSTKQYYNNLSSLLNLFRNNKIFGIYFSSAIMSLAGLPPFSGFFGKFFLFFSLINSNYLFLFIFLNIINLIGLFYYLRIIRLIFINNKKTPPLFLKIPSRLLSIILSFFFLINISFFFFSEILLTFCQSLALDFLGAIYI